MRVLSRFDKILDIHLIGPPFEMDALFAYGYNKRQVMKLKNIVSLTDWNWDKCGIDQGEYNFTIHLCTDKDNPLYYFQNELLVDFFETVQGGYYPAITAEQSAAHAMDPGDAMFGMEEWNESNDIFWQQWVRLEMMFRQQGVRLEMKSTMNPPLYSSGLRKRGRSEYDGMRWGGNSDGANTFAHNLIWYKHRMHNGRCMPGEKFYIAYISLHSVKSIRSVIMAVGVFVQEDGFYSTMGITKSFRLAMSDTTHAFELMQSDQEAFEMSTEEYPQDPVATPEDWINLYKRENIVRGRSVELQRYIANELTRLGHRTHGLLFRPNGTMRGIMMTKIRQFLIGSNVDVMHIKQQTSFGVLNNDLTFIDDPPLIIQSNDGVIPTICIDGGAPIKTPFWEPPLPYSHPDASLNPHLPLMFIRMGELTGPRNDD